MIAVTVAALGTRLASSSGRPHSITVDAAAAQDTAPSRVATAAVDPSASRGAPAIDAPYYQQLGGDALARIDYPWRRLGYGLAFEPARPGLLGTTSCAGRQMVIYVYPSESVAEVAFVTAFEIGHAVDCSILTPPRRADWARIRGFGSARPWFPSCTCSEDDYGSGDYAEVFATWQVGLQFAWRSALAGPPDRSEMARLMPYLA